MIGAGESGKSTILKQMRIIYSEGFHMDERKEIRQVIFSNMIVAFKIIAEEMRELGMEYENPQSPVPPSPRSSNMPRLTSPRNMSG
jgi:guanine nucleotide-binding protein subunit alpha